MALALLSATAASAVEYAPMLNATILGGQYFFEGKRSSLNGNANVQAAVAMKLDDTWSLLPTYSSVYQGTKGVTDGVGAGTLYQQDMVHRLGVAGIRRASGSTWGLKPSVSYSRDFLKETRDEAWGRGLFDYEKIAAGVELENVYKDPFSYRFGLDVYRIHFPNFQTLESAAGTDPQGNPLTRSVTDKDVLDTLNTQASFAGVWPYPFEEPVVSIQAGYSLLYQRFIDQRLVDQRGQLGDKERQDFLNTLSAGVVYPRALRWGDRQMRLDSSVSVALAHNGSNQNTYDAGQVKFVPDSYSYYSYSVGPAATLSWGDSKKPATVSASVRYTRLQYLGRLAQEGSSVYSSTHQHQDRYQLGLAYAYPVSPGFYFRAQANYMIAQSNQAYEQFYSYSYRTSNYLMGFSFEY